MDPVKTAASNFVYRGPSPEVGDLWVQRVPPREVRSVWELTDDERQMIAEGGRIELAVYMEPLPPVGLAVLPAEETPAIGPNEHRIEITDEDRERMDRAS